MISVAMQILGNLLYVASFLLIVFSFFRPSRKFLPFQNTYAFLLILVGTIILFVIQEDEIHMLLESILVLGILLLFCEGSLRCVGQYYIFALIFLGLSNAIAMMLIGDVAEQAASAIAQSAGVRMAATNTMIMTFLTLCILLPFCVWVRCSFPKGLQDLTGKEFLQYLLVAAVDMILVVWIIGLTGSAGEITNRRSLYLTIAIGIYLQLFFLFRTLVLGHVYIEKNEITEKYLETQKFHYEYLEKREYDTRKFRHDLRGHMLVLESMINNGEKDAMIEYVKQLGERIHTLGSLIQTSNGIADAIVNQYDAKMKSSNIDFLVRGQFPADCSLSSMDICTILSNLLSNALEGVEKCGGGQVELEIRHDESRIYLAVKNDCSPKIHYSWSTTDRRAFLPTSKDNSGDHGFGLENVRDCVRDNHGWMQIDACNGSFAVLIALQNTEDKS